MSTEADQRALKIKTGTVRRLRKELGMYSEEVSRGTAKVAGMREEGADPYDIKYAVRRERPPPPALGGKERCCCSSHPTCCCCPFSTWNWPRGAAASSRQAPTAPLRAAGPLTGALRSRLPPSLPCLHENILAESTAMVPDTRQRLEAALRELAGLLEEAGGEVEGSEEAAAAREEVAAAQPLLE